MRILTEGGLVWGLGMYASGSTWLFNTVLLLAEAMAPALPRERWFVARREDVGARASARRLLLVKSHETDAAAEQALGDAADLIVVTIRDPLDVVASMMRHQRKAFAEALELTEQSALQCARQAASPRALVLRYEAGFIDDPVTLDRLAARLGGAPPAETLAAVFAATRRGEVERRIAALPATPGVLVNAATGDLLDPATHWHSHHANRTGEVGRWRRELDAAQVAKVQHRLAAWLAAHFYREGRTL